MKTTKTAMTWNEELFHLTVQFQRATDAYHDAKTSLRRALKKLKKHCANKPPGALMEQKIEEHLAIWQTVL